MVGRGLGLVGAGILGISYVVRNQVECSFTVLRHNVADKNGDFGGTGKQGFSDNLANQEDEISTEKFTLMR